MALLLRSFAFCCFREKLSGFRLVLWVWSIFLSYVLLPGLLVGSRFRSSQAELCADVLRDRAQQVKREVDSIFAVFLSSVPFTRI